MKSPCRCCRDRFLSITMRFDPVGGLICPECHEFLAAADKVLRRHGIEGVESEPVRYKPEGREP